MTEAIQTEWTPELDDVWQRITRAFNHVRTERLRQVAKWGGREGDGVENPSQSNYVRLRVLAEEFGEVAEAMGRPEDGNGKRDLFTELVQVAAVAVAWIEALEDDGRESSTDKGGE